MYQVGSARARGTRLQFHHEAAVVKHPDGEENAERFMDYETALSFFEGLPDAAKMKNRK